MLQAHSLHADETAIDRCSLFHFRHGRPRLVVLVDGGIVHLPILFRVALCVECSLGEDGVL